MVSNLSMETIAIKENNTQRIHKLYKTLDTICCYPSKGSREVVNIPAKQIANMQHGGMHFYTARWAGAKKAIYPSQMCPSTAPIIPPLCSKPSYGLSLPQY